MLVKSKTYMKCIRVQEYKCLQIGIKGTNNFISKLLVLTSKALINQILIVHRNSCFLPPVNWKSGEVVKDLRFISGTRFQS